MFGLSQSRANYWIHFLSMILRETLKNMNFIPERVLSELLEKLLEEEEQDLSIDGTERKRSAPPLLHSNRRQNRSWQPFAPLPDHLSDIRPG
jgi:hypothetical protein